MKLSSSEFGTTKYGETVIEYKLETETLCISLLNYGATLRTLKVPDCSGKFVDVILGYDSVNEYETQDGFVGACIGRVSNRIGNAQFLLNGKTFILDNNDGKNHLHGGRHGFDKHIWEAETLADGIRFSRISPDQEEGYPGNLTVSVEYRIVGRSVVINYDAMSDADTLCSLTNHAYFNLNGVGSVLGHKLYINADSYLENDTSCLPTGKVISVQNTPFDFRKEKEIGKDIDNKDDQLVLFGGYDHNFCLNHNGGLCEAAILSSDKTGIQMIVSTTMPGLQVYTANSLALRGGKYDDTYSEHSALCLETQFFPNAMNCPHFRKPILRRNEKYHHVTILEFGNTKKSI